MYWCIGYGSQGRWACWAAEEQRDEGDQWHPGQLHPRLEVQPLGAQGEPVVLFIIVGFKHFLVMFITFNFWHRGVCFVTAGCFWQFVFLFIINSFWHCVVLFITASCWHVVVFFIIGSCWHSAVLFITDNLWHLMELCLTDRKILLMFKDVPAHHHVQSGGPQGSPNIPHPRAFVQSMLKGTLFSFLSFAIWLSDLPSDLKSELSATCSITSTSHTKSAWCMYQAALHVPSSSWPRNCLN